MTGTAHPETGPGLRRAGATTRLVDLSHVVSQDMLIHPWMPRPIVSEFISRRQSAAFLEGGVSFHQVHVTVAGNTGTILQTPFQYHANLPDLATVPLEWLVDIPTVVIRVPDVPVIGPDVLDGIDDLAGAAVLFQTGRDRHWGTEEYFEDSHYLTGETIERLIDERPRIVGVDSKNTDSGSDQGKPAQHGLLGGGTLVLTSLTRLGELPDRGALLTVLPAGVAGMSSFPVRAVAAVPA